MTDAKFNVYGDVTEQSAGTPPWHKPWTGGTIGKALPCGETAKPIAASTF